MRGSTEQGEISYPMLRDGVLNADDLHSIYYAMYGMEDARITFLFLHGGPGLGCSVSDLNFFDLKRCKVVLLDQRGCGKSLPAGSLTNNTTQHILEDIDALLELLDLKEVVFFGGSWGSTLSLAYAIHNPNRVDGMILRGLFTGTLDETKFWTSRSIRQGNLPAWERLLSLVPIQFRSDPVAFINTAEINHIFL